MILHSLNPWTKKITFCFTFKTIITIEDGVTKGGSAILSLPQKQLYRKKNYWEYDEFIEHG
jgi:hypothetical protein